MLICPPSSRAHKASAAPRVAQVEAPRDEFDSVRTKLLLEDWRSCLTSVIDGNNRRQALEVIKRIGIVKGMETCDQQLSRYMEASCRLEKQARDIHTRDVDVINSKMRRYHDSSDDFKCRLEQAESRLMSSFAAIEQGIYEAQADSTRQKACLRLEIVFNRAITNVIDAATRLMRKNAAQPLHIENRFLTNSTLALTLRGFTLSRNSCGRESRVRMHNEFACRLLRRALRGVQLRQLFSLLSTLALLN